MEQQRVAKLHSLECIDLEANTIPIQEYFNKVEDNEDNLNHPIKANANNIYQRIKVLQWPTAEEGQREAPQAGVTTSAPAPGDSDSLAALIGFWVRLWSRLSLLGAPRRRRPGWARLPLTLLNALLAVSLLAQAATSASTLLGVPGGAIFFVRLQACEHFSLLSLLLPALWLRAGAFRRVLALMERIHTLPAFRNVALARPRRWVLFIMAVACAVFVGLQALHVAGGLTTMPFEQHQRLPEVRFSLFPPLVRSDSDALHLAVLVLQVCWEPPFSEKFSPTVADARGINELSMGPTKAPFLAKEVLFAVGYYDPFRTFRTFWYINFTHSDKIKIW